MNPVAWKYVPDFIGVLDRRSGKFHPDARVKSVDLHNPVKSNTHPGTAIRGDAHLVSIHTEYGTRNYGVAEGCITSRLKMAVKLLPGQERDEVVAKWKNAPANACRSKGLSGSRRKRRR